MSLGKENIAVLLSTVQASFVGTVGKNATTTSIPLVGVDLGSVDLASGYVLFAYGALGTGSDAQAQTITSNTHDTLTIPAVSAAPTEGADIWLYASADAPANTAQKFAALTSIGTSTSVVADLGVDPRRAILIYNSGTTTLYVGTSVVTVDDGLPIKAGGSWVDERGAALTTYLVSSAAGGKARVYEKG